MVCSQEFFLDFTNPKPMNRIQKGREYGALFRISSESFMQPLCHADKKLIQSDIRHFFAFHSSKELSGIGICKYLHTAGQGFKHYSIF